MSKKDNSKQIEKAIQKREEMVKRYKQGYSKNQLISELNRFNLKGNVVDSGWFEHLKNEKGKIQPNAIFVLSEIVFWYRPTIIYDEHTGNIKALKAKFKGDMLQKSYKQLAEKFGLTDRQVKEACDFLEEKGIIVRDFRTITLPSGRKANNVLYIGLILENLRKISVLMNDSLDVVEDEIEELEEEPGNVEPVEDDDPITKKRNSLLQKNVTPYYEKKEQAITKKCKTNTESISTENTNTDIKDINLNPNLNLIEDKLNLIWNLKIPMNLKQKIKVKVKASTINLSDSQLLDIEHAYHYHIQKMNIKRDAEYNDPDYLNDFDFSDTIDKMLEKVTGDIQNMRGLIQSWIHKKLDWKWNQYGEVLNGYEVPENDEEEDENDIM